MEMRDKALFMEQENSTTERGNSMIRNHNAKVVEIDNALQAQDYDKLVKMLTITTHSPTSKMKDKVSLSTSVAMNPYCKARQADVSCVCHYCFANSINNAKPTVRRSCKRNSMILWNIIIPVEYWEKVKLTKAQRENMKNGFRLESLGDTFNDTQAVNYLNFVKAFPNITFTLWSKNWAIWYTIFEKYGKPENMIYIHSSSKVNVIDEPPCPMKKYLDYVFTVYEREYAINHPEVKYNCCTPFERRQCVRDCNECYSKGNYKYRGEILRK